MRNGKYQTANGSTVYVSDKTLGGVIRIGFDWLEEGGCIECEPIEPEDVDELRLIWHCDYCGGGSAELFN